MRKRPNRPVTNLLSRGFAEPPVLARPYEAEPVAQCAKPAEKKSTKDIFKLVRFYVENIREHDQRELHGIYRQIQNLEAKGITLADIHLAMKCASENEFIRNLPMMQRPSIRRFCSEIKIKQWIERAKRSTCTDPGMLMIEQLEARARGEL